MLTTRLSPPPPPNTYRCKRVSTNFIALTSRLIIFIAAFVWSRELVFTVFTSEVVNTTRDFEKIFASPVHKLWRKMASDRPINKLDDKQLLEFGINNIYRISEQDTHVGYYVACERWFILFWTRWKFADNYGCWCWAGKTGNHLCS